MKETIINWPNGGMGNTVYCLLFLCSEELNDGKELILNELNFHNLASDLNCPSIKRVHGSNISLKPNQTNVVCSHSDFLFIQLLRLYKWYEKIPTYDDLVYFDIHKLSNAEKLEHLVLWLYGYKIPEFNFDIYDFFLPNAHDKLSQFIISRGLTPNNRLEEFINYVTHMNKSYLDEYHFLQNVLVEALNGTNKEIYLKLHQQAFIMVWMMHKGFKFKLMPEVNNINQFLQYIEE